MLIERHTRDITIGSRREQLRVEGSDVGPGSSSQVFQLMEQFTHALPGTSGKWLVTSTWRC